MFKNKTPYQKHSLHATIGCLVLALVLVLMGIIMKTEILYEVVVEIGDITNFERMVSEKLNNGWSRSGDLIVLVSHDEEDGVQIHFYQPVTKVKIINRG